MLNFFCANEKETLGGHDRADLLEALVFAIYLDKGFDAAAAFVEKHILIHALWFIDPVPFDPKKELLRRLKEKEPDGSDFSSLNYRDVSSAEDEGAAIEVTLRSEVLGRGIAQLPKDARNAAAQDALNRLDEPSL